MKVKVTRKTCYFRAQCKLSKSCADCTIGKCQRIGPGGYNRCKYCKYIGNCRFDLRVGCV